MTALPELPLADWRPTKDTLHLYSQVVGTVRLATTAPRNHWWNVPLYVDVHGLSTRRLHHAGTTFQIDFDLLAQRLRIRPIDGREAGFDLRDGLSVAAFYDALFEALGDLGVDLRIRAEPYGVPMTTPFAEDREH